MSLRSASNQLRARTLHSSIPFTSIGSALRSEIGAALVAAVAVNADAGDLSGVLQPFKDEARQVFQRWLPQRLDLVEELMVERLLHFRHAAFEQAEVEQHSRGRIGRAAQAHFGTKRVTVDFLTGLAERRSL